ncbi:ABC transporter ATP-binding protein [Oceanotoga teriensis]|jgi:ABC-2 type transport system ATP-binding protein|uniref:ABC-2 type transport system ATP-binding protein n=1 Tax=Oceanotoga teriensis TaxID=515440 RepID=A0AA45C600_9BACT|nr:ATP-binding cassette domain-containing protein [Oceanotoga teriensis]MDO7975718.1 ATP-binding cassette domain-containing protein [Oceanotoga teriensis]PWJ90534.1 ABC-2 type transport system ATP-binding protein [Oceanotoga teriensis]
MSFTVIAENLEKKFIIKKKKLFKKTEKKELKAVKDISFQIKKGEIFGLLGPNGAGKTTTIKMLSGLLKPSNGKIFLNNIDVNKEPLKALKNIGTVLAGDRSVYWKLTARENLEYFAALYGYNGKEGKKRTQYILNKIDLEDRADELVEKYSTGMKQKVALGKALIPDAPVVLLDEPTLGLDPQAALNLRKIILNLKDEGKTILLTTHYMEEADFLSDRIAIIDNGEIIAIDTPEKLKKSLNETKKIKFKITNYSKKLEKELNQIKNIKNLMYKYDANEEKHIIIIHQNNGHEIIDDVLNILNTNNSKILSMNIKETTLEDVFLNITGKNLKN